MQNLARLFTFVIKTFSFAILVLKRANHTKFYITATKHKANAYNVNILFTIVTSFDLQLTWRILMADDLLLVHMLQARVRIIDRSRDEGSTK